MKDFQAIKTIKIVNKDAPQGFSRINESDFDPKRHTRYKEPVAKDEKTAGKNANSEVGGKPPAK